MERFLADESRGDDGLVSSGFCIVVMEMVDHYLGDEDILVRDDGDTVMTVMLVIAFVLLFVRRLQMTTRRGDDYDATYPHYAVHGLCH